MTNIPWIKEVERAYVSFASVLLLGLATMTFCSCGRQKSADTVYFDLEEGQAVETLKEASQQAEVEFFFSSDLVSDLKTPAIRGKYTPAEAFEILLADSSFVVIQHEQSGVYSIRKIAGR